MGSNVVIIYERLVGAKIRGTKAKVMVKTSA